MHALRHHSGEVPANDAAKWNSVADVSHVCLVRPLRLFLEVSVVAAVADFARCAIPADTVRVPIVAKLVTANMHL